MKHFIDSAQEYISNTFDDLQQVEIIVPNNRTGAALLSSLKKNANKVCWAPKITPIKEIFARNTKLHDAENVVMIYILYNVFIRHISDDEKGPSFDNFYNFGDVLLSDFDDIDKYLVNPQKLFCNIADAKEIDVKFDGIEDELIEILKSFWTNISSNSVLEKKLKSLELWQKMPAIYEDFTKALREKGIGYQGMIYRDFVEKRMFTTDFDSDNYAFVGFSALNECEKSLFRHIRDITNGKNGKCLFFWDADKYYIKNESEEAGLFLRSDIKEFPLPKGFELSDSIKDLYQKNIQVIEVPSSVAQVKVIPDLLKEYGKFDENTAIILGDEKLLVPLIYTIPQTLEIDGETKDIKCNITMGYPLSYTASASFVQIIMKLAMHRSAGKSLDSKTYLNRKDISAAIMHSFPRKYIPTELVDGINEITKKSKIDYIDSKSLRELIDQNDMLKVLFNVAEMRSSFPKYIISVCKFVYENILCDNVQKTESDFMHRIITLYTSFINALGDNIAFERDNMYYKLMTSIIKKNNMSFESNSDEPVQILGFMETRCLDFDNIIMLSMNEDTFPKSSYKDSLIPYNLRKAFSMPSIEFQNGIFAYYFYRLLQRCKNIRMLYSTQGKISHAEKSRFITQIEYELNPQGILEKKMNHNQIKSYEVRPSLTPTIEIKKDNAIEKIEELLGCKANKKGEKSGAYPKLINTYLTCPVKFYFEYIEGLKEEKDDTTALDFGNLLHESCHYLYHDYIGKGNLQKEDFTKIRSKIDEAIDHAICRTFNINKDDENLFNEAKSSLMINPIRKYIEKIVDNDEAYAPFQIVDLENETIQNGDKNKNYTIEYPVGGKTVLLKGIIDRIDLKENKLRVIDYKTSSIDNSKKTYDENFWLAKPIVDIYNSKESDPSKHLPEKFKDKEAVQVLIYSEIMTQLNPQCSVQPYIISVTNINDGALKYKEPNGKRNSLKSIESYQDNILIEGEEISLREDFNQKLENVLADLLNKETTFKQTENLENCKHCPYKKICNRNNE